MEQRGHPILYTLAAAFFMWPGGAVAGYLYSQAAREASYLRGAPDNSLFHNPIFCIVAGVLLPPITSGLFGYLYSQKEVELADLKVGIARQQIINRDPYISEVMAQQREPGYWRDHTSQLDQVRYQDR